MDQKIWIRFKKENVDPHSFCTRIVIKKTDNVRIRFSRNYSISIWNIFLISLKINEIFQIELNGPPLYITESFRIKKNGKKMFNTVKKENSNKVSKGTVSIKR